MNAPDRAVRRRQRWLLITVAAGVFVAADDQTSIVTMLPAMIEDIGLTVDDLYRASWIVNGYLLGYIVALPIVGRIADVYGHARVYAGALALFMFGSVLVALGPGFEAIVVSRAIQAVGGGAVVPVAMAIVVDELPRDRRLLGLGAIAAASEAGALLGPLWGGAITEWFGWRWVFWINVPMALPILVAAWYLAGTKRQQSGIDWLGAALLGASLAVLTFALVDDPNDARPFAVTLAFLGVSVALGLVFWWHERRTAAPLVRPEMLRSPAVLAANLTSVLLGGGLIAVLIGVPLFVNLVLGEGALDGGLTLMRLTVAVPIGALAGGWLGGRMGLRTVATAGMLLAAVAFAGLQAWNETVSQTLRTLPLLVGGFGFGLVIAPLSAAVLQQVGEDDRATAASWLTLSRVTGMLAGAALLTSSGLGRFYARAGTIDIGSPEFDALVREAEVSTFREVFIVAGLAMVVAAILAWWIGHGDRDDADEPWWTVT
ncbi:MAG: MFS transporter [Chloroflexi bacterium]|nr:MFS transporter [Chloroflexota bacterium]